MCICALVAFVYQVLIVYNNVDWDKSGVILIWNFVLVDNYVMTYFFLFTFIKTINLLIYKTSWQLEKLEEK